MWENLIVAVSNFPAIYPIITCYQNQDYITLITIGFVAIASLLSHVVENHKHGMPGIGVSNQISYLLNRFDVL